MKFVGLTDNKSPNPMEDILFLIKFTKKEYAESLLKKGQIYFNVSRSFHGLKDGERGDENEGAEWIDFTPIVKIRAANPTVGTFELTPSFNAPSRVTQYNYSYLSYSLYALKYGQFANDNTHRIDARMSEFGDSAVVIEDIGLFLSSIVTKLKSDGIEYEISPVTYCDLSTGRIELNPFYKKQEHQHQCEFRIIIRNINDCARIIEIGSIERYAKLTSSQSIIDTILTAKRASIPPPEQ